MRDETKYARMLAFARVLPAIRRRVAADLRRAPLSRERVLATVVALLERTLIRVGNDEYARTNGSFGLTTLLDRHVDVRGRRVRFRFRAKSGVMQKIDLEDALLARSVQRCQDLPGQTLFQYVDETGAQRTISSTDVNAYIREVAGEDFTAKDFRTWSGTVLAACALCADIELAIGDGAQALRVRGHRRGRRAARQHQGGVPQVLRPPDGDRRLPRGRDDRAVRPHHRRRQSGRHQLSRGRGGGGEAPHRAARGPHQASRGVTRLDLVGSHSRRGLRDSATARTRQPLAQVRQRFPHGARPGAPLARILIRGTVARRLKCHAGFLAEHPGPVAARQLERSV